jgi:predicted DNA-binding transcriptional regulator YafY
MRNTLRYIEIERIISQGRISRHALLEKLKSRIRPYSDSSFDQDLKFMRNQLNAEIGYKKSGLNQGYFYSPHSPKIFSENVLPLRKEQEKDLNFAFDILRSKAALPMLRYGVEIINEIVNDRIGNLKNDMVMVEETSSQVLGSEYLSELYQFIKDRQPVSIDYHKFGEPRPKKKTISPYLLREYRGFWYLVGYTHDFNGAGPDVIVLALHRIKGLRSANVNFHQVPGFSVAAYFKDSIGIFHHYSDTPKKIRFWASELASEILEARKIHSSQRMVRSMVFKGQKGRLYELKVLYSFELINFFFERSNLVRALEPKELVKGVKERLASMKKLYA